jgi:hypothetical protein
MHHAKVMTNSDKKENLHSMIDQNVKSAQYENTPQNVVYNAAPI